MQQYAIKLLHSVLMPSKIFQCNLFFHITKRATSCTRYLCILPNQSITAGIIIIGDEILKGQVRDTNSFFLAQKLNELGLSVKKIVVIPDDTKVIATEVAEQSERYSVVITSGGIGPTHDDVTYEAIAKAFNDELSFNSILVDFCKEYFGCAFDSQSPTFKLAQIPNSSILYFGKDKETGKQFKFPLVSVKNVYIFPGVPSLMEKSFNVFQNAFQNRHQTLHFNEIFLNLDEVSVTPILNAAVQKFQGSVTFGSYPVFSHNYYSVRLTMESKTKHDVKEACNFLTDHLPKGCIVNYDKNAILKAREQVYSLANSNQKVAVALKIIEDCLQKFQLPELCVSFNGGKDCTALLYLLYACVKNVINSEQKIQALYIRNSNTFPQVESFIQNAVNEYNLSLYTVEGPMLQAFNQFIENNPKIKVMLMGSRRSDPGMENVSYFCMTDGEWKSVMRVMPLLDWTYSDVWLFLRNLYVPYCSLYDVGYTSLGCKNTSSPNPSLKYTNHRGRICYHPAYMLKTTEQERAGRQ